jgi:uncharacterized protein with ParB-like and HNH nuclease domain
MSIIKEKKVLELKENFRIPLYQREYAWGEDEVIQLLEDLKLFKEKRNQENYFLGNIVVSENDGYLDVIDGQQRLTTLFLILKILDKNKEIFNLNYEIREEDREFLKEFNLDKWKADKIDKKDINSNLKENIKVILKWKRENKDIFKSILENVVVTITNIPKEVDVVKYFEVMNNRGKQLEKHEILKAKFLKVLQDEKTDYAKIWDYCSAMDSSIEDLIYYNDFKKEERKEGTVENLRKKLIEKFTHSKFKNKDSISHETILELIKENENNDEKELHSKHSYRSVVKFPIFLLQTLKIFKAKYKYDKVKSLDKIVVNDRYLLDYFYNENKFIFDKENAKKFIELLLKLRILFDYFIFKRDLDKNEEPMFLPLIGENKNLLMIELLFNVSAPQYFSQDWIVVLLAWLDKFLEEKEIKIEKGKIANTEIIEEIVNFLENFDKELAKIRLSNKKIIEFINEKLENIYNNKKNNISINYDLNKLDDKINQGTSTPHYWFYKLDYLLWRDYDFNQNFKNKFDENEKFKYKDIKKLFRLSRLNSIEHIWPQSKKKDFELNDCKIDNFGNLALISNHLNSALLDETFENNIAQMRLFSPNILTTIGKPKNEVFPKVVTNKKEAVVFLSNLKSFEVKNPKNIPISIVKSPIPKTCQI